MNTFSIKYRRPILILFITAAVLGAILGSLVSVNYDMSDYLPEEAPSTAAIRIMKNEFNEDLPNTRIMLTDVGILEVLEFKEKLKEIPGITTVTWLDDVIGSNIPQSTPLEFLDQAIVKEYYKDNKALLTAAVERGMESSAINDVYELAEGNAAISGDAANTAAFQSMAVSEVLTAMAFVIPIILIILILTTTSWLEPLLFLITIGIAVLINMGTTYFFSEISFVTRTVTPILQLAVSMDYAIFLLHSFNEHKTANEPREAMKLAVKQSLPIVAASAATTVIGFSALLFMRFRIGPDLGIHLAKGVFLSFLCVVIFLPALTISFNNMLEKKHKKLFPDFKKAGRILMKTRIPFLILALIVVIPCFLAQSNTGYIYGMGGTSEELRVNKDTAMTESVFGKENTLVLLVPKEDTGKETQLCDELDSISNVISYVTTVGSEIPSGFVPKEAYDRFYSENYTRIIIYTDTPTEGEEAFNTVSMIKEAAGNYYRDYYLTGQSAALYDMKNIIETDTTKVNLAAILGIFIVLLLTFRSFILPVLLVFTIETAIWINLSFAYFTGSKLSFIGYLIISTVQLGATVDYAILLSSRYLANRKNLPKKDAMHKTLRDNLIAVFVSSGILTTAGFTLSGTSGNPIVSELGTLLGRGTILSVIMVICVLPALLIIFDKLIVKKGELIK